MKKPVYHVLLQGTNYEVGKTIAKNLKQVPGLVENLIVHDKFISGLEEKQMYQLFDTYCPGINEEIEGFADELSLSRLQVLYYVATYLRPGCSQMAILPSKTSNGHTILARTYDFNDDVDDMTLTTTRINGKYAHISSSLMQFGRSEGLNDQGLAVSQSSAGVPVGNFDFALKPAITGLQFWAVIRSVLENCKNVEEAVQWTKEMPIAYNINLIVADKSGEAALIESFDGKIAIRRIDANTKEQYICSTNHIHLNELKANSSMSMKNSLHRYQLIHDFINHKGKISVKDIKELFSTKYPSGLCCHYYEDFFGAVRSVIYDVNEGSVEITFGSPDINPWHSFTFINRYEQTVYQAEIEKIKSPIDFYELIPD